MTCVWNGVSSERGRFMLVINIYHRYRRKKKSMPFAHFPLNRGIQMEKGNIMWDMVSKALYFKPFEKMCPLNTLFFCTAENVFCMVRYSLLPSLFFMSLSYFHKAKKKHKSNNYTFSYIFACRFSRLGLKYNSFRAFSCTCSWLWRWITQSWLSK